MAKRKGYNLSHAIYAVRDLPIEKTTICQFSDTKMKLVEELAGLIASAKSKKAEWDTVSASAADMGLYDEPTRKGFAAYADDLKEDYDCIQARVQEIFREAGL